MTKTILRTSTVRRLKKFVTPGLINVYSHPRSGTHFLFAFLARNFYPNKNLSSNGPIQFGHWSNRILKEEGEEHLQLHGNHFFPNENIEKITSPMIYIYRDGRAVAYSLWKSKYYNKDWGDLTFSEYLRKPLDWLGGPGQKRESEFNIAQHWYHHVDLWHKVKNKNLLILKYEDLKSDPTDVYKQIVTKFFPFKRLKYALFKTMDDNKIDPVADPVGLHPNKAEIDSYKSIFTEADNDFFLSCLPCKKYLTDNS